MTAERQHAIRYALRTAASADEPVDLVPGRWELDPERCWAEVSIRHAVVRQVRARLGPVRGTVFVETDVESSRVSATIDMTSLDTGDRSRDEKLRSAGYLDVGRFPLATFTSTRVTAVDRWHWRVDGDLTISGTTRPVAVAVRLQDLSGGVDGGDLASLVATAHVDRSAFGLTWNQVLETGGLLLGPTLDVCLVLDAVRRSDGRALRP